MKCIAVIQFHINLKVVGKAWLSADISTLLKLRSVSSSSYYQELLSAKYHDFVIAHLSKMGLLSVFKALHRDVSTGSWLLDSRVKMSCAKSLIRNVRRRHYHTDTKDVYLGKKIDIPNVTMEEVREYLHGGEDPLCDSIRHLSHQIESTKMTTNINKNILDVLLKSLDEHSYNNRKKAVPFYFYQNLTTEDVFFTICDIVLKSERHNKKNLDIDGRHKHRKIRYVDTVQEDGSKGLDMITPFAKNILTSSIDTTHTSISNSSAVHNVHAPLMPRPSNQTGSSKKGDIRRLVTLS
jgi:hypothetical protein